MPLLPVHRLADRLTCPLLSRAAAQRFTVRRSPRLLPCYLALLGCLSVPAHSATLLDSLDYETGLGCWGSVSTAVGRRQEQVVIQSKIVRKGTKAGQYWLRRDWDYASSPRAQLICTKGGSGDIRNGKEYWIGESLYFPANWVDDNPGNPEALGYVHKRSGVRAAQCSAWLQVVGDQLMTNICHPPVKGKYCEAPKPIARMSELKGQWTDVVMHFKCSMGADGYTQIWLNGHKVFDYHGPTTPDDTNTQGSNYGELTLYKWWYQSEPSKAPERILYRDEYKLAEGPDGYALVDPAGGSSSPSPALPSKPVGLVLSVTPP